MTPTGPLPNIDQEPYLGLLCAGFILLMTIIFLIAFWNDRT